MVMDTAVIPFNLDFNNDELLKDDLSELLASRYFKKEFETMTLN
jgi:hypothetical protein